MGWEREEGVPGEGEVSASQLPLLPAPPRLAHTHSTGNCFFPGEGSDVG